MNTIFNSAINYIVSLILLVAWIAGFVIAKGFWSTFFCWFPFWSYYLVIELLLKRFNLI